MVADEELNNYLIAKFKSLIAMLLSEPVKEATVKKSDKNEFDFFSLQHSTMYIYIRDPNIIFSSLFHTH